MTDAPDDLVERLSAYAEDFEAQEAAAEITRLRERVAALEAENARLKERISPDAKAIAKSLRQWSDEDVRIASGQLPPLNHREKTMGYIAARYIEALWSNFERAEAERDEFSRSIDKICTERDAQLVRVCRERDALKHDIERYIARDAERDPGPGPGPGPGTGTGTGPGTGTASASSPSS